MRGVTFVRELQGPPGAPALVLLHGWTVTADLNWFTSYRALGEHYRVVALDHRAHGRGIRSWKPFRLEDCADDVAALAAQLEIDSLVAVGYSMGGPVAQLLWKRHPEVVDGMVLSATAQSFTRQDLANQLYLASLMGLSMVSRFTPGVVRRTVADGLIRRRLEGVSMRDWVASELLRNDTTGVLEAGIALRSFDSSAWSSDIDVPTASVVTTRDQVVSPRRQLALAGSIPGTSIHRVDSDHTACANDSALFVPALLDAVASVTGRVTKATTKP